MKKYSGAMSVALAAILLNACGEKAPVATEDSNSQAAITPEFRDLNANGVLDVYENSDLPLEARVDDIISRLSLTQKTRLVTGTGMNIEDYNNPTTRVPGAAGYTYPLEELGIPSIALADGPAGLRILPKRKGDDATYYATAFPVATALASTWDTEMLKTVGEAMGNEVLEYGVDVFLAPGMNIHRNPLGGRNFEYYSEDPILSGKMGAAMASGAEARGIGVTLKHYVANNQETNRFLVDTVVSERALREIYLRGFEIAVSEAQPWAIMSSYNKVNGVYTPQSRALLTDVLRGEWGFKGLVMTDWWGGDSAVDQMRAGNDLIMPGEKEEALELEAAVQSNELDEATLDTNLRRILTVILQSPTFAGYQYSNNPDLKAHADIARQAAAEGVVLLKNDGNTLPLADSARNFAVLGNTSYAFISGGTGSGDVNEAYTISLVDALKAKGFVLDEKLENAYRAFIAEEYAKLPERAHFLALEEPIPEMPLSSEQLREMARTADVGLLTIGRNSGEFQDRKIENDFNLSASEQQLITAASQAFHAEGKQLIVILNIGNVVETASWRDKVDAIVLPWQGGQEAGNALVDVLTGAVNPSAKLATTFPKAYEDVPSANSFPGETLSDEVISGIGGYAKGNPSRVKYEEGIYVGYRYYDTFGIEPAYPFGYGLSYTDFDYGSVTLSDENFSDSIQVSVTIRNTGDVAGKEVVQLYLSAPEGSMAKPVKELKGFAKTRHLAPGESQQLQFSLQARDLASFSEERKAWIAEPGDYRVSIGASSRDIRATGSFKLDSELTVVGNLVDLSPERDPETITP